MATYTGLMLWLKDRNTSIPDKLKLSKFAWGSEAVHIPNKQQQLLDFVCGLLVNKKKHKVLGRDVLSTWKTLLLFLKVSGQTAHVKPSILQAVVEDLGKVAEGKDQSDKNFDLQETVTSCACNLLLLHSVAATPFELLCSVLTSACSLKSSADTRLSACADRLLVTVLPVLVRCQRAHLQQPQVLHVVTDKVLACALKVIDRFPTHISHCLEDFLVACLLHSDHLETYSIYLRRSCGEPAPGQPKQPSKIMTSLFTALTTLIGQVDTRIATAKFIPAYLQSFLNKNKTEPRICFLMLKRLVKLMTPSFGTDDLVNDEAEDKAQRGQGRSVAEKGQMSGSGWLEGVTACISVCRNEPDLDLFAASRQGGDVLAWFSKLTQLVISQERDPSWFDFMRHMLGLNHLVVEKSWDTVLLHCLTSSQQTPELQSAQDLCLCEFVSVYVRLRRASDLLSALMAACLADNGHYTVSSIQSSAHFHTRLSEMVSEVPITTVLEMWDKVQTKAVLLVEAVASLSSSNQDKTGILSQLDWILGLYCVLLGNARLFDHRRAGAFSSRISALVGSVGEQVLAPLYKIKQVENQCMSVPRLLRAWSYLQVMLLPRWRESEENSGNPKHMKTLNKWIKRLEGFDQAKMSLQRCTVASSSSSPMVVEGEAGASTLEQVVVKLLEMPPLTSDIVSTVGESQVSGSTEMATGISQYTSLCQLLPLTGANLSENVLHGCADLTVNILGCGHGYSWTSVESNEKLQNQGQVTLLSMARNLLQHPAIKELRPFQLRMAKEAAHQIRQDLSSSSKKVKKTGTSTSSRKLARCSDEDLNDFFSSALDANSLDFDSHISSRIEEMVKVWSCLALEYLPDVNSCCQGWAIGLLRSLAGLEDCDSLKVSLERLLMRSLSVAHTHSTQGPKELLQFAIDYCDQTCSVSKPLLDVSVQAVMNDHTAVLQMPGIVKQLLADLDSDTPSKSCIKFQLLSLIVRHCHKYLKKVYHVKEVGGAATEVYFHVARYVIKHGLDWYRTTEERSKSHDAMVAKEAGSVLASVGKKRKRKDKPSVPSGMGERVLVAQAWHAMLSCVTEVLDLWDEEVAEAKVNQHLQQLLDQVMDQVLAKLSHKVERTELAFIRSLCHCQLRSSTRSEQVVDTGETETANGPSNWRQLLSVESYPKLWTICFCEAKSVGNGILMEPQKPEECGSTTGKSLYTDGADNTTKDKLETFLRGSGDVGPTTDVLCALLESSTSDMFATLLRTVQECLVSTDLDPSAVIVAVDVWCKLLSSPLLPDHSSQHLFKNMYQLLSSMTSVVQNFVHRSSFSDGGSLGQQSCQVWATRERVACRCVVRALADFVGLGKTLVTPRLTLLCLHAGINLDLAHPTDVDSVCNLVNTLLVRHTNTALTAVPAILDLVNKLVRTCMSLGRQERLTHEPELLPGVLHSTHLVTRLMTLLSTSTYKAELQKVAHTVLAEYLTGMQKQTLHTTVKAELLRGLYKLMAVSDKYRLAALNAALPAGVKDTFKVMHQEFNKYHRYAGAV